MVVTNNGKSYTQFIYPSTNSDTGDHDYQLKFMLKILWLGNSHSHIIFHVTVAPDIPKLRSLFPFVWFICTYSLTYNFFKMEPWLFLNKWNGLSQNLNSVYGFHLLYQQKLNYSIWCTIQLFFLNIHCWSRGLYMLSIQ